MDPSSNISGSGNITNCVRVALKCQSLYPNDSEAIQFCYLEDCFASRRIEAVRRWCLTAVFSAIFVCGVAGNVLTWIVIRSRQRMRESSTGAYLRQLALADLVTLISGLPPEVYLVWERYPWRLGALVCSGKGWVLETTTTVSVLTILAFCLERYVAICRSLDLASLDRLRKRRPAVLGAIWAVAALTAAPYGFFTRIREVGMGWPGNLNETFEPFNHKLTRICSFDITDTTVKIIYPYMFHLSALMFFLVPLGVLSVLCHLIARSVAESSSFRSPGLGQRSKASVGSNVFDSKRTLSILLGVVVAFFVCHAPFQLQRLLFVWLHTRYFIDRYLFILSGILFYMSSTVNPILYNMTTRRYREAFFEVVFRRPKRRRKYGTANTFETPLERSYDVQMCAMLTSNGKPNTLAIADGNSFCDQ